MPPLPDVDKVCKVVLHYSISSDVVNQTRLYFRYSGTAGTVAQMSAWADQIATVFIPQCALLMHPQVGLTAVDTVDLSTTSSPAGHTDVAIPGTRTGGPLPGGTAFLVNYLLARRYRGGKPRSYLPFGTDTDVQSAQKWTAAFLSTAGGDWQTFLARVTSEGIPSSFSSVVHCNVSYYEGWEPAETTSGRPFAKPKLRPTPRVDDITGQLADPSFGSQRRRQR